MKIGDYKNLIFFDTETTGFDAQKNRIIEIAAVRICDYGLSEMDSLVKLPDGERVPEKIAEITNITDLMLEADGVNEIEAAAEFAALMGGIDKTLLIAHNAQFDLNFIGRMFMRFRGDHREWLDWFMAADYLDSLTVYKDRRAYPHKLANAITAYGLDGKVVNSHRAIDDCKALYEVCKAMNEERADLADYINIFGFNPKYGISGSTLKKVTYRAQSYRERMAAEEYTLPAIIRKEKRNV